MKNILCIVWLLSTLLHAECPSFVAALQKQCDAHDTLIVGDFTRNFSCPPLRRLRIIPHSTDLLKSKKLSTTGLTTLRASGSSQFTPKHLKTIFNKICKIDNKACIYIVDIRQEHHGFVRSKNKASFPICWYKSSMNCINWNKEKKEIKETEREELDSLKDQKSVQVYIKDSEEWPVFGEPVTLKPKHSFSLYIKDAYTEKEIITDLGGRYKRFHVADRQHPSDHQVDAFVNFIKSAPKNAWFHFHCRAGKGRTTTFLVMYDMMHNARKLTAEEIMERQSILADYKLTGGHSNPLINNLKISRLNFLHAFYQYAREQAPHFAIPFSAWRMTELTWQK